MSSQLEATARPPTLAAFPVAKPVLVVDDSQDDIMLTRLMFRRSRILNPVYAVGNVRDAICYLKGEGIYSDRAAYPFPALLFTDLHLPDGSGFDILRYLQANTVSPPWL